MFGRQEHATIAFVRLCCLIGRCGGSLARTSTKRLQLQKRPDALSLPELTRLRLGFQCPRKACCHDTSDRRWHKFNISSDFYNPFKAVALGRSYTQQHANLHSVTRFSTRPGLSVPCIVTICMSARM